MIVHTEADISTTPKPKADRDMVDLMIWSSPVSWNPTDFLRISMLEQCTADGGNTEGVKFVETSKTSLITITMSRLENV